MKSKKVVFRVDGSQNIGMGHLIRCLALALMLKEEFEITFFWIEVPTNVEMEIINSGFAVVKIINDDNFLELINRSDIVVLDHYGLGTDYQKKIKVIGCKLVCIDDLHDKDFFADLIINHSPGIIESDYTSQEYTQFALGLDYVLLRPSFLEQAVKSRVIDKYKTILICFGGSDFNNLTERALKIVCEFNSFERIIVVTGSAFAFMKQLNFFIESCSNVESYHNINELEMVSLLTQSDLVIVPASGILMEAISVGCKSISGMYIENQKYAFREFKIANLIISAENFSENNIRDAIITALDTPFQQKKPIDGNQKERLLSKFRSLCSLN
jgi:UDP-2,4-diacetamido-2,4,6-trideoxy-beta-L-altropyranose hydrolase